MTARFKLTGSILSQVAPVITGSRADEIASIITQVCPMYGIDRADILHEFIANVLHESACFTKLSENLNYSVHGLLSTFGRHRISLADAEKYGRKPGQPANQRAIANILYGGKWGRDNLGNALPGDGWNFRGCGPIHITGRGNVTRFTNYYNQQSVNRHTPELMAGMLRSDLTLGMHSACWVFSVAKSLNDEATNDDMRTIVRKINGAYLGWDDRSKYYGLAKKFIIDSA